MLKPNMYSAGKRFSFSFAVASDRINGRFFPHARFVIACQKFVRCSHRKGAPQAFRPFPSKRGPGKFPNPRGLRYRHCVRQLADAIGWTSTGAPFATFLPAAIGIRGAPSMVPTSRRLRCKLRMARKSSDRRATAELLIATIEAAIARAGVGPTARAERRISRASEAPPTLSRHLAPVG